ncbi:efflux RND transporter periplasmic adaptor subunit [Roseivivax isoporae]|uniref:Multidrug transporter n=1 Tax=Roseivivax isoporae LMG 25204 TaxID=1449351 RepID=X7FCR9_9RHOB|nr:efflux RND transporter periplasmic adaptor subunit [Roseivivax isoporae]ETX30605.1 multidrug transporter [Roseivivax isoporae LMG 25204]
MSVLKQLLLCVAVLAAAVVLWARYVPSAAQVLDRYGIADMLGIEVAEAAAPAAGGFGGGGPAQVVVAPAGSGTIGDRVEALGDGQALRAVTLRAEVGGEVAEIGLSTTGYVEEGQVILRLDDAAERIEVERARLLLEEARVEAERIEQLRETGAVTEVRSREVRLALRTAELALRQAEYDLAQRVVPAPLSGWLGVLDVQVGDRLSAGDEIGTITDRSALLIDFRVPERVIGRIDAGSPVIAHPLARPGVTLEGRIHAIDNVVDRASRTLRVQARVDNADDLLRAGMAFTVEMTFPGDTLPSVDPLAVQWSAEGSYVWVVRDAAAVRVPVTIRQRDADRVLVEADLAPDEPVVVEGVQSLRPGAAVSVVDGRDAELARDGSAPRAEL